MSLATTDLCDAHGDNVRVVEAKVRDYGARREFAGIITTLKVYEDNVLVRAALEEPGHGRVLVVDGAASLRCALVGDLIAALAHTNGWEGIIINGAIRDSAAVGAIQIGIKALGTCPRRSAKNGQGQRDVTISIGEVTFSPGAWLAADADGIVVADGPLEG